jgi:hypothetical protein
MKNLAFAVTMLLPALGLAASAHADDPFECRNAWEAQRADVDGPVLAVTDLGAGRGDAGRYRIVVRDRFTGCRVGDNTNTVCRIGQHASIVGGSLGLWSGDEKNADSDYPYVGKHVWTCE